MRRIITVLSILLIFFGTATAALAWEPPSPTRAFYVNDYAGVLDSDTQQYIIDSGEVLYARTGAQVVVLTVKDLEGRPLEEYSLEVLRGWGIGDSKKDNGVLILLSTGDRRARIEVGYGLEGALPDGKTGRIQDEYMLPYFREGDYSKGILNGYNAILKEISKEYDIEEGLLGNDKALRKEDETNILSVAILIVLAIAALILDRIFLGGALFRLIIIMLLSGRRGGGGGSWGGGGGGGNRGGGGRGGGGGSSRGW